MPPQADVEFGPSGFLPLQSGAASTGPTPAYGGGRGRELATVGPVTFRLTVTVQPWTLDVDALVLSVGPNEYGQLGQAFRSTNPQLTLPAAEDIAASLTPTTPLVVALVAGTAEQTSSFSGLGSSAIPTSTAPPSTAPPSTAPASSTAPSSTAPSPAAATSLGYAILATVREGGTSQSGAASGEVTQLDTIRRAVLAAIAAAAGWGVHQATRRGSRHTPKRHHRRLLVFIDDLERCQPAARTRSARR